MSQSHGSKGVVSATAGLAVLLNLFIPVLTESLTQETIAIASPILAGITIFIGDWTIAKIGFQPAQAMRIRNSVQDQIDTLHKNIKRHQDSNLPTNKLEEELENAVIAQSQQEQALRKDLLKP